MRKVIILGICSLFLQTRALADDHENINREETAISVTAEHPQLSEQDSTALQSADTSVEEEEIIQGGQELEDAVAPSLSLPDDTEVPMYRFALWVDPVAILIDGYGATAAVALGRFASLSLSPWGHQSNQGTLGLEASVAFRPLGRGLHGPLIGAGGGAWMARQNREHAFRVFVEAGHSHVWGGVLLGGALGYERQFEESSSKNHFRVRVFLGLAWR